MGRTLRRVPGDWQHPKDDRGYYLPMYDDTFGNALRTYIEDVRRFISTGKTWEGCLCPETKHGWEEVSDSVGDPPDPSLYRPAWPEGYATHFQMYEDTSEGTPISPVFSTPEEVARWCADNGASWFGGMPATYDDWMNVCNGASSGGVLISIDGKPPEVA